MSHRKRRRLRRDTAFEDSVINHCLHKPLASNATGAAPAQMPKIYASRSPDDKIKGPHGKTLPLVRHKLAAGHAYIAQPFRYKIARVQGFVNEMSALGRDGPFKADFEDARRYGVDGIGQPDAPLLAYNRRSVAQNVSLWPLPGYHEIGIPQFAQLDETDQIRFEDKQDRVAWRGALAGRTKAHRPSIDTLEELVATEDDNARIALLDEFYSVSRFQFVTNYLAHPDFDICLTYPNRQNHGVETSLLDIYFTARVPLKWTHQFKYVACFAGYDTGSNFFTIANSNSLMFKESDGWELFYTDVFKPWEHFIPLARGASDIAEKLDWARSNPDSCKKIVKRCRETCRKFADIAMRHRILNTELDVHQQAIA